jgi:APA family basic amino acid/polyamine antiporter
MFGSVDPQTNMPANAGVLALLLCAGWYFYFYGANLSAPIFGVFSFDSSELPIISIYAIYIPIFIAFIRKEGKTQRFKNVVMPILAIVAAAFMIFVAFYAHGIRPWRAAAEQGEFAFPVLFYLIVFAAILSLGALWYRKHND